MGIHTVTAILAKPEGLLSKSLSYGLFFCLPYMMVLTVGYGQHFQQRLPGEMTSQLECPTVPPVTCGPVSRLCRPAAPVRAASLGQPSSLASWCIFYDASPTASKEFV